MLYVNMYTLLVCISLGLALVSAGHGNVSPYSGKNAYRGSYKGKCSHDGIFYHGDNSLVFCSNGAARIQYCAPGTRNSHRSHYSVGHTYGYTAFCDVNLNDYGYGAKYHHGGYHNAGHHGGGYGHHGGYGGHHGKSYRGGYGGGYGGYGYNNGYGGYGGGYGHGYGGNAYGGNHGAHHGGHGGHGGHGVHVGHGGHGVHGHGGHGHGAHQGGLHGGHHGGHHGAHGGHHGHGHH